MGAQRRSTITSYSLSRVLIFTYLLSANPSSAFAVPKECWKLDNIAKIIQCVAMVLKENPEIAKDIHNTIKALAEMVEKVGPDKAGIFAGFALSLYLAYETFELWFKTLPQHMENVKHIKEELSLIYEHKIVPVLKEMDDLLVNWQYFQIEKITNELIASLKEIREKLEDFLEKVRIDKRKNIEEQSRAVLFGIVSAAVAIGSAVKAVAFPPAGVVMVICYFAVIVGLGTAYANYTKRSELVENENELEELQDKIYKFKGQIAEGESKVKSILMESYRTVGPIILVFISSVLYAILLYARSTDDIS